MPIPYTVSRFLPGRIQIKSIFLRYAGVEDSALEQFIAQNEGVSRVKASTRTGTLTIEYDPKKFSVGALLSLLDTATPQMISFALAQTKNGNGKKPKAESEGGAKRWFASTTLGLVPFALGAAVSGGALTVMTLALALPIFRKAINSIRNRKIDVHLLDSSALAIATLRGSPFASMLMVWLLSLGDYIEEKTQGRAKKEIEKLLSYKDERAWLVRGDGNAIEVPVNQIQKGDRVVVYTGEKISIDGLIDEGEALVNQASLTGESNPALKAKGERVYAGTFIEDGKLYITADKIGDETALAKIVSIIQESINEPIETQKSAEDLANKFVIPTFLTSGTLYALTGNINSTISTLTFDYHTGIHVSTPAAIMSHMALAARRGILIKSGRHLEILHNVDTIVFDKTGTLTVGYPEITEIVSYKVSADEALALAASLEQRLTHPVAKSIVQRAADKGLEILQRRESKYHRGLGVEAQINGGKFLIGSTKFMEKEHIKISKKVQEDVDRLHEGGVSALYLVDNTSIVALIGVADPLRPESKAVVGALHKLGRDVILCTGDNEGAAEVVAKKLGIKKFHARAFPDEKAAIIKSLKARGRRVAFLGDGVNDSPALSVADIGISINSGADIAIEVADVVINSDLNNLIEAIQISDMALRNIKQNYRINTLANSIGMVGAVGGALNPVVSTVINNGITILIGINAIKPLWNGSEAEIKREILS
ncbi:MAG: heavy metal translocating P-type ATPase [Deltaproteobacteria bacterium]